MHYYPPRRSYTSRTRCDRHSAHIFHLLRRLRTLCPRYSVADAIASPITDVTRARETSTAERIDITLSTRCTYKLLRELLGNLEINSRNLTSHHRRCDIKLARRSPETRSVYLKSVVVRKHTFARMFISCRNVA